MLLFDRFLLKAIIIMPVSPYYVYSKTLTFR